MSVVRSWFCTSVFQNAHGLCRKYRFCVLYVLTRHTGKEEDIMFTLSNYPLPDKIDVLKREGYRLLGYAWLCDKYGLEPIDQIKCNVIVHPKKKLGCIRN